MTMTMTMSIDLKLMCINCWMRMIHFPVTLFMLETMTMSIHLSSQSKLSLKMTFVLGRPLTCFSILAKAVETEIHVDINREEFLASVRNITKLSYFAVYDSWESSVVSTFNTNDQVYF
ncbi:transmembrane protein, putative [Medicago truncatula]|uniref:Transmembrane protein, putative n=1 Tax=Medicago truncatula TaxID=3880 RepID=A0A072UL10_MEDTR|nr:transmembrane protein, putative [Medicago truncatula]